MLFSVRHPTNLQYFYGIPSLSQKFKNKWNKK